MPRLFSLPTLLLLLLLADPAHAQLVPDGATVERVATGYQFTEGPAAGPDHAIYFTDIPAKLIIRYDPDTSESTTFRGNSGRANGLMFDSQGRLTACEGANDGGTRRLTRTEPDGSITSLVDQWQDKKLNSPNDLEIDELGGIYFTDPRYGKRDDMQMDIEAVFYLAPDGTLTRIIHDLQRPNGIILSPDGNTLYVADNAAKKLVAYDVNTPGQPENPRRFSDMGAGNGGGCDGMTVDPQGRLYATGNEGVYVFNPDGTQAALIPTPEHPSNCTFANDNQTLYITARTSLYRITLNTADP
jgi:gluconolactonase